MNTKNNSSVLMRFLIVSNLILIGFISYLFLSGFSGGKNKRFTEITAERIRAKLYVDNATGEAKLEFLDEKGEVSAVFPK